MTDKGKILSFPDRAAIDEEAAAWVARFDAGDVSAKEQAAFQEWLNRSQLHRDAIEDFGALWAEFDGLKLLTGPSEDGRGVNRGFRHIPVLSGARYWLAASAAALTAVAAVAVLFPRPPQETAKGDRPALVRTAAPAPVGKLVYQTPVGAQKRVTLADGSSVMLNTDSRLEVDFSPRRRDIRLVRGEAYFDVVHDKARPFTVYADSYVVRDIGTAFDVHLSRSGKVEVGVTKGSVQVSAADGRRVSGQASKIIVAGHNVVLEDSVERAEVIVNPDLERKLAWRQGELIYSGQPLGEVLSDIGRYSDITIELADPALEKLPVGGAFRTDQIEAIFAALETNFGIQAQWLGPQHVRFTSAADKTSGRD